MRFHPLLTLFLYCCGAFSVFADPLNHWRPVYSPSFIADIDAVLFTNNQYVATCSVYEHGASGSVLTSPDGLNWTPHIVPEARILKDIAYGNGLYVVVGFAFGKDNAGKDTDREKGGFRILTSSDGTNWTLRAAGVGVSLNRIIRSPTLFVAVGTARDDEGRHSVIYTSPDGLTWKRHNWNGRNLRGLTFANGRYLAVGEDGTIAGSPNGVTWSLRRNSPGKTLDDVAWGNGLYVAVGEGLQVLYSSDTVLWKRHEMNANIEVAGRRFPYPGWYSRILHNGERFIAGGADGSLMSSTNGIAWTPHRLPGGTFDLSYTFIHGMTWANDRLLVVTGDNTHNEDRKNPHRIFLSASTKDENVWAPSEKELTKKKNSKRQKRGKK